MKLTYLTSITIFTLSCLASPLIPNAQAQTRFRVVDPFAPSVTEIPPLKDSSTSPFVDITKIWGENLEDNTSFAEKPSSQFTKDILIRVNEAMANGDPIIGQTTAIPNNVNEIRRNLEMTPLGGSNSQSENSKNIPVENIPSFRK